ncbi:MAG: MHYT domain-containing protein [Caldimonas sp.]
MQFLVPRYDPWAVALSIGIAGFASYVALDLAKRVRGDDQRIARNWWIGGSVALGTGIWSMHFIGMLAFSIPVELGYAPVLTVVSWLTAIAVSAVALAVAGKDTLGWRRLALGSAIMGIGMAAMHYTGMAALDMVPGIVWNPGLVAGSLGIAVIASTAALQIFFWLRRVADRRSYLYQSLAALVMGGAISGMHYTGMAAAAFPVGSVCLSAGAMGGHTLNTLVALSAFTLLAITLVTSIFDGRMQTNTARLAASLQTANDGLRHERERYRALTELSSDWFWERDRHGRCTSLSAGMRASAGGGELEDHLGKTIWELGWTPIDPTTLRRFKEQVMRREVFRDLELRRIDADGRVQFISTSGAPLFDDAGECIGYRGVGRDITEHRRRERRENLQHTVTRLLAEPGSVHDRVSAVLRAVCKICDWPGGFYHHVDRATGAMRTEGEWSEPEAAEVFVCLLQCKSRDERDRIAAAAGLSACFVCPVLAGEVVRGALEFRYRNEGGDDAETLDVVRTLGLQIGQFIARRDAEASLHHERELLAERVRERTLELSETNRRLELAKIGAEEANRAKSSFLATMSHEIRTPMNGVIGMIEVLSQSNLGEDQIDAVQTIRACGFSLLALIDDILDFSKIEAGQLELERTPVALAELVEEVCTLLGSDASANGVDLSLTVAPDLPKRVWSDATRLRQTLNNIVGNAVKFSTGRDGVRGRVVVRVERTAGPPQSIALSVIDNGIGIAATTLEHLFKPFKQAEASTTRRFGGTGLGLVISKRLVTLMGGEIQVRSEPSVGSTFTVTLPLETVDDDAARGHPILAGPDPRRASITPSIERRVAPTVAQARADSRLILVAEDDAVNQKVILKQLALLGHAAEVASNGVEALRVWQNGCHALLLCDLHMPELDGYGLARAIREAEGRRVEPARLPILALTANALRDEAKRVHAAGMDEYLTKPIQLAALGAALERWLGPVASYALPAMPRPEAAARPAGAAVDVSVLKSLVGDDMDTVREFLAEFLHSARSQAAEIIASCEAHDTGSVGAVAHKLKASSRSVGALALGDLCAELEDASRAGRQAEIVERRERFESAMNAVDRCIVETLAESPA